MNPNPIARLTLQASSQLETDPDMTTGQSIERISVIYCNYSKLFYIRKIYPPTQGRDKLKPLTTNRYRIFYLNGRVD